MMVSLTKIHDIPDRGAVHFTKATPNLQYKDKCTNVQTLADAIFKVKPFFSHFIIINFFILC
jgi:hypothetical protein